MKKISRRNFLLASGVVTIGAALTACGGSSSTSTAAFRNLSQGWDFRQFRHGWSSSLSSVRPSRSIKPSKLLHQIVLNKLAYGMFT